MKVKYKGPLPRAVIPRVGIYIRGEIVEVPDQLGRRLVSAGSFIEIIEEPKEMPPKTKVWASKKLPEKPKKVEKPVEVEKPTETKLPEEAEEPVEVEISVETEAFEAPPEREEEE